MIGHTLYDLNELLITPKKQKMINLTRNIFSIGHVYFYIELYKLSSTYYKVSHITLPVDTVRRNFKLVKEIISQDEQFWTN